MATNQPSDRTADSKEGRSLDQTPKKACRSSLRLAQSADLHS